MDERAEIQRIRNNICGMQKSWNAANLRVHADGNWLMFYDENTKKQINSPRLKDFSRHRVSYRAKKRFDPQPEPEVSPLDSFKYDNYTRLPSRHLFCETPNNDAQKNTPHFVLPNLYPKPTEFKGYQPLELPLRFSTLLLNEKRQTEREQCYSARRPKFKPRSISPPQTARKGSIYNSLYKRSLKPDELEFKWGPGVEEKAKELYAPKKH